jgi:hypothetical protein
MTDWLSNVNRLLERLKGSALTVPTVEWLPPAQCIPSDQAGPKIRKESSYFAVRINEVCLREGRRLWQEYDPMVLVTTEFNHVEPATTVPFVVGPILFNKFKSTIGSDLPHGLIYRNILVAGPHPFRGGNFALTIVLYKVARINYAKDMLKIVENLSAAVGAPANIGLLTKVSNVLLDGLESLLNLEGTVPLIGARIELDSFVDGLSPGFGILSNDTRTPLDMLRVSNGRLTIDGSGKPYCGSDYVLFSVVGLNKREDENTLPFYELKRQAIDALLSGGAGGWDRAKALLMTMYQQMVLCPDLIRAEADAIFEDVKEQLLGIRKKQADNVLLSVGNKAQKEDSRSKLGISADLNSVAADLAHIS